MNVIKPVRVRGLTVLNALDEICNKTTSRWRVAVEHALGHLKRYKLLAGIHRCSGKSL